MSNPSPLTALVGIIASSVQALESAYSQQGAAFPSLDEPYSPGPLNNDATVAATTRLIVAAAHQLIATVREPLETIHDYAPGMYMSASLGLVTDINVPEVLKDAPTGLHVDAIAEKVEVDSGKLARVMRYLATRHVFKEVSPDVFANNRVSSVLVKAHPLEELKTNKVTKYVGATGAAIVGHITDEGLTSAPFIIDYIRDSPKDALAPFNLAYKTKATLWDWYEEPGNEWRGLRFATAMTGGGERFPPTIFTEGFDWKSLKEGSIVVDVGGSVGSVTFAIASAFPHLKYIVQDLAKVVDDPGQKFWQERSPQSISSGAVTLQAHSFFDPQPVKNAAVYFMRLVLHDWPEDTCIAILKHLRAAAGPSSKLIIFDMLMPYACPDPAGGPPPPPAPLLANLGIAIGGFITAVDLQMLNFFNGQERTLKQFITLGAATGWKFEAVNPGPLAALVFSTV
ncbi:S-adenosyl-L-methionine-dependent methyltransferase [Artomyces pyxidatus]|uniref:S-adenosyl-L-methionine-dependent methyltransferase n=1 Tax=Artomyces pyxidatus TaxID=48021 RepID=A0ACB8T8K0_9AGAM|nr:S-adenosyl-L-methionine-dependent methyltransferase [Artomyces pyxidatus]